MKAIIPFILFVAGFVPLQAADESPAPYTALFAHADFQLPSSKLASTDFKLPQLDGKLLSLSSLRGSVVLLNFWATWCPPCRAEIPSMESLHAKLKGKGLKVLAIDVAEEKGKVQEFVKKNKMEATVLLDATGEIGGTYGASSIPITYVIGKDGNVLARTVGSRVWDTPQMVSLFESLLESR